MNAIQDILKALPISDLAASLGATKSDTKSAATEVITSLLGGMQLNSADESGAESLSAALGDHAQRDTLEQAATDINSVDTKDGAKIVEHVFGESTKQAASQLSAKTGTSSGLIQKLLPVLAPIVLGYIAKQMAAPKAEPAQATESAANITSILGTMLGNTLNPPAEKSSTNVLGSILDALF